MQPFVHVFLTGSVNVPNKRFITVKDRTLTLVAERVRRKVANSKTGRALTGQPCVCRWARLRLPRRLPYRRYQRARRTPKTSPIPQGSPKNRRISEDRLCRDGWDFSSPAPTLPRLSSNWGRQTYGRNCQFTSAFGGKLNQNCRGRTRPSQTHSGDRPGLQVGKCQIPSAHFSY